VQPIKAAMWIDKYKNQFAHVIVGIICTRRRRQIFTGVNTLCRAPFVAVFIDFVCVPGQMDWSELKDGANCK
jgi:hypothetical protein